MTPRGERYYVCVRKPSLHSNPAVLTELQPTHRLITMAGVIPKLHQHKNFLVVSNQLTDS